jgi:hypothetical protein
MAGIGGGDLLYRHVARRGLAAGSEAAMSEIDIVLAEFLTADSEATRGPGD